MAYYSVVFSGFIHVAFNSIPVPFLMNNTILYEYTHTFI